MQSTAGKNAVLIVEMATKGLEYYLNLVDKAVTSFEKIESNFKEVLLWVNAVKQHLMLQRNLS